MFTITTNPSNTKYSLFRPIEFAGTLTTDKVVVGMSTINVRIEVTAANADGNVIAFLGTNVYDIQVGDLIYIMAGAYKGFHKVYFKDFSGMVPYVHLLTPFVGTETAKDLHNVTRNLLKVTGSSEIANIRPEINTADNSFRVNVAPYFQAESYLLEPAPDSDNPVRTVDASVEAYYAALSASVSFEFQVVYSAAQNADLQDKEEAALDFTKPLASNIILWNNYTNFTPWLKAGGVYEFIFPPQGNADIASWFADRGVYVNSIGSFANCDLCATAPEIALNLVFLNKFGGFQNYVCLGETTIGRSIENASEFVTSYPYTRRIGNPGDIYKTYEIALVNIDNTHRDIVVELIESPVAFIYDESNEVLIECIVEKKSYQIYSTSEETYNIRFNVVVAEKILVQTR